MPAFRIKLYGLSDADKTSLKSMLKLVSDLLTHQWVIVGVKSDAELSIYSFDSEEGIAAWQQRDNTLTALLTNKGNITEPIDIVLKKPLRTSNFSEVLNIVEDKITSKNQALVAKEKRPTEQVKEVKNSAKKSPSLFASLSSNLSKYLSKQEKVAPKPELILKIVEESPIPADSILEIAALKKWIEQQNNQDNHIFVSTLLSNLVPLNRTPVPSQKRLELLELYHNAINNIIFTHVATENQQFNRTLDLALEELAIGYKIVVNFIFNDESKPYSNGIFIFAVNRAVRQLILHILHAYTIYAVEPKHAFHELHQLYMYADQYKFSHKQITLKKLKTSGNIFHFYNQFMLCAIADPYSLAKREVIKLFNLMDKLADKVEITSLTKKQIAATSDFLMTGHFCIDPASDKLPIALTKTPTEIRSLAQTRLLNTQTILHIIGDIIQHNSLDGQNIHEIDVQLLKKILPQLNTTYEREFHRLPAAKNRYITVAIGIASIHAHICELPSEDTVIWTVLNQGEGGLLTSSSEDRDDKPLRIGDFIGIFEPDMPIKLAEIKWLQMTRDDITAIGLEYHLGEPTAVTCTADNEDSSYPALLIPEHDRIHQPTLIAEKGLFSASRGLTIINKDKPMTITADTLIENAFNYEQFSFTISK
ncbi:MAG: hypothetical protein COB23_01665 [Methylophaga sp.]|nr:MAG: hypothetical protein COB23_01665 [Methylophaga sp.]